MHDKQDEARRHEELGPMLPTLVGGWAQYPSVLERYYNTYTTSNHQALHVHSNGICLLGLARTHAALQPGVRVTRVAFRDHDGKNLLATDVRGKRKNGAIFFNPRDMVCELGTSDGATHTLYACVRARVIEINRRLVDDPSLLADAHLGGYVAVLMPKIDEKRSIGEACMEFDHASPLDAPSGNLKRRQENEARWGGGKRPRGGKICWEFERKGTCKFGSKCRFVHGAEVDGGASADGAPGPAAETAVPAAVAAPAPADGAEQAGAQVPASEQCAAGGAAPAPTPSGSADGAPGGPRDA